MAKEFEIHFVYGAAVIPEMKTEVTYRITEDGVIHVQVHYFGKENLPELPVFGMRFIMPTSAEGYHYEGLSGETYPDRMSGGISGCCDTLSGASGLWCPHGNKVGWSSTDEGA